VEARSGKHAIESRIEGESQFRSRIPVIFVWKCIDVLNTLLIFGGSSDSGVPSYASRRYRLDFDHPMNGRSNNRRWSGESDW
jgi:hypothetical protein